MGGVFKEEVRVPTNVLTQIEHSTANHAAAGRGFRTSRLASSEAALPMRLHSLPIEPEHRRYDTSDRAG